MKKRNISTNFGRAPAAAWRDEAMTLDIIISPVVVDAIPWLVLYLIFGGIGTTACVMDGYWGWPAVLRGYVSAGIIMVVVAVGVSLVMSTPLSIQILNVSIGAP
jgi:hypothetical protein